MLRTIRLTLAIVFFAIITLLFLDFSGTLHGYMGWILLLQWLGPQIMGLLSAFKTRSVRLIAILPVVCWFMALGGLAVFNAVYCDVKHLMIMLYVGHILSLKRHGRYVDE